MWVFRPFSTLCLFVMLTKIFWCFWWPHRRIGLGMRTFATKQNKKNRNHRLVFVISHYCSYPILMLRGCWLWTNADLPRECKGVMQNIWIEKKLISDHQFKLIQRRVDQIVAPTGIGRIPYKIQSGFSAFTADQ